MSRASLPRLASVYSRPDGIVVHAHARTDAGAWIAALPAFRLGGEVGPAQLGTAVRTALSSGRHGVPLPAREHYREQLRPVCEAAGVKSWAALERGARLCTILQESPAELRIVPTRNAARAGMTRGFTTCRRWRSR